eukprot:403340042
MSKQQLLQLPSPRQILNKQNANNNNHPNSNLNKLKNQLNSPSCINLSQPMSNLQSNRDDIQFTQKLKPVEKKIMKTFKILRPKSAYQGPNQYQNIMGNVRRQRPVSKRIVTTVRITQIEQTPDKTNEDTYFKQPPIDFQANSPNQSKIMQKDQQLSPNNLNFFQKRKLLGPLDLYLDVIEKRRREEEHRQMLANMPTPEQLQQQHEEERQRQLQLPIKNFQLVMQNKIVSVTNRGQSSVTAIQNKNGQFQRCQTAGYFRERVNLNNIREVNEKENPIKVFGESQILEQLEKDQSTHQLRNIMNKDRIMSAHPMYGNRMAFNKL